MTTHRTTTLLVGFALSLSAAGCTPSSEAAETRTTPIAAAAEPAAAAKVARIVFVGKQEACDCTRTAIDAAWAALQKVLGAPAKVPVMRLQIDTQEDEVEPYRRQRAMVALPALYFVDQEGSVVALLQGDVSEAQIAGALNR